MANVRALNQKIGSLRNMQKVMRAMNMIASTKFRQLILRQEARQEFAVALDAVNDNLMAHLSAVNDPLIQGYPEVTRTAVILYTADRGLCGSHNSAIHKALVSLRAETDGELAVVSIGRKGTRFCQRNDYPLFLTAESELKKFSVTELRRLSNDILRRYSAGDVQRVYMVFNRFISSLRQETVTRQLLPLMSSAEGGAAEPFASDLAPAELLQAASRQVVFYRLQLALAHSRLSEQAARMTAMENASTNSETLIDRYRMIKNRARQAAITRELSEIVAGKEAMKG